MASLLKNPSHRAAIGYSGFDMSQRKQFTSAPGMLLPVYFDLLQPGDKVDCSVSTMTRFQPMATPVFASIKEHVDWFFVPLEQIYSQFGSVFFGINDPKSVQINPANASGEYFPYIPAGTATTLIEGLVTPDQTSEADPIAKLPAFCDRIRLLEHLGLPMETLAQVDTTSGSMLGIPLWFAGAYQKIYNDHYRLDNFEAPQVSTWNFDNVSSNAQVTSIPIINNVFSLRYAPYERDYLTYYFPSPLMGNGSSVPSAGPDSLNKVSQWLSGISSVSRRSPSSSSAAAGAGSVGSNNTTPTTVTLNSWSGIAAGDVTNQINPANLRTLFATEKLLEITRRAGKHYDLQQLAHFGVDLPNGIEGRAYFLGGKTNTITNQNGIYDIFSTNQSSEVALGQMAGQAFGRLVDKNIKFEASCHGVLMAIYYVVPDITYEQTGYDGLNMVFGPSGFPRPEYDNLGMEPITHSEAYFLNATDGAGIFGWKYRYYRFKQKKDVAFAGAIGNMHNWFMTRVAGEPGVQPLDNLICRPDIFNDFMVAKFVHYVDVNDIGTDPRAGLVNCVFAYDPLVNDFKFNVYKSSKMSTYGLPSL